MHDDEWRLHGSIYKPGSPTSKWPSFLLADALGEESFVDLNGNGVYDTTIPDTYTDMPEPFLDANENGRRDAWEEFIDTDASGSYSSADGEFNGILRDASISARGVPTTIHVRGLLTIILSGSYAEITVSSNPIVLGYCMDGVPFNNFPVTFGVKVEDVNGNVMPAGTTISFGATNGTILTTPTSYTVPNTSAMSPPTYTVVMQSDAKQDATLKCTNEKIYGIFTVTVTTPKGLVTYPYNDTLIILISASSGARGKHGDSSVVST